MPARYKGLKGGRGGAKSHFVAGRLIEDCLSDHHRVACLREFQSSIQESSKQLISDKIREMGFANDFRETQNEIIGPNDSLFIFKGLQGHSAESLRSIEGFTRAWVEEARTTSQASLDHMTPTFRAKGVEMYFCWNPYDDKDPVDKLFADNVPAGQVVSDDGDFICIRSYYWDNPWFPEGLRIDMERDRVRDPDRYAHIWLGEYQRISEARVFRNWKIQQFETPEGVVFRHGADWGFATDPSVLVRCYVREDVPRVLFVDQEVYAVGCPIERLPDLFDGVPGSRKWPIVADSARPETIDYMQRHGFPQMVAAIKGPGSVEDGIEFLKGYDIIVHPRCRHTANEMSRYAYKIDRHTQRVLPILADKDNHVIDSLRYAVEGIRRVKGPIVIPQAAMSFATRRMIPQRSIIRGSGAFR